MKTAILYGGVSYQHYFFTRKEGKYRQRFTDRIYILDLHRTELRQYDYVIVPTRLNQDMLCEHSEQFRHYLDQGGHIISFGEIEKPWLSPVNWKFYPTNFYWWVNQGADLPLYPVDADHPLFQKISVDDAKWHYHGVFRLEAGTGAEPVLVNELGEAIICVDRQSYKGNMYITTLDPDYHFGQGFIPKVETFLDGYLAWIEEDIMQGSRLNK